MLSRQWLCHHIYIYADSQRCHKEGTSPPATSTRLCCWDCHGTEYLGVLQRSSSQTRRYLWVIFFSRSRRTSKESAGLKVHVLAIISQNVLKSVNKLPLSVNWSYLCWKTPNIDLVGIHKEVWIKMFSMLLSFINGTTGTWADSTSTWLLILIGLFLNSK